MRILILLMSLLASISYADQKKVIRKVAQDGKCSEYYVVELKVHDKGIEQNVKGGAFVHDSVYIGVALGPDATQAGSNATASCQSGKYPVEDCQNATHTLYSGNEPKYNEAVKTITGCKN